MEKGQKRRRRCSQDSLPVTHVLNLANDLQGVVHGGDHVVQTVSEYLHLSAEGDVALQTVDGNIGEGAEFLLGARRLLEDPTKLQIDRNSI